MKKSFVIHVDMLDCIDAMSDSAIADLFRIIKAYHTETSLDYQELDPVSIAIFPLFRNQFERDNEKYENRCKANRENGKLGGRPKTQKTQSVILETQEKPTETKKPDSDNDNDINKNIRSNGFDQFWIVYPKKVKKKQALEIWKRKQLGPTAQQLIDDVNNRLAKDQRWKDGFIPDPTTYLNGERWSDEISAPQSNDQEKYKAWYDSADGIRQKGQEYGLYECDFGHFQSFKSRVFWTARQNGEVVP